MWNLETPLARPIDDDGRPPRQLFCTIALMRQMSRRSNGIAVSAFLHSNDDRTLSYLLPHIKKIKFIRIIANMVSCSKIYQESWSTIVDPIISHKWWPVNLDLSHDAFSLSRSCPFLSSFLICCPVVILWNYTYSVLENNSLTNCDTSTQNSPWWPLGVNANSVMKIYCSQTCRSSRICQFDTLLLSQ
jgi:hypothetical protein